MKHPHAPIPRRLADPGERQRFVFPRYPDPCLVPRTGLGRESQEIGTGAQTGFQLCGLPV